MVSACESCASERASLEEYARRAFSAESELARELARRVAAEKRLAAAEECLRHAARELVYVHMHEEVGGPDLVHTSEGDAVIALSEKLLGPMATWPEEPNAGQRAFLAGGAKP